MIVKQEPTKMNKIPPQTKRKSLPFSASWAKLHLTTAYTNYVSMVNLMPNEKHSLTGFELYVMS